MAEVEIYATDGTGHIDRMGPLHRDFGDSFDIILPGRWGGPGILLYDRSAGHGEIRNVSRSGDTTILREWDNWRTSWDAIVPGYFARGAGTDLLFYDGDAGHVEIYDLDASGNMVRSRRITGWGHDYDVVLPGWWSSVFPYTDLLFYDRGAGRLEICHVISTLRLLGIRTYADFGSNWDLVVTGRFAGGTAGLYDDIVRYDRSEGVGEILASTDLGLIEVDELRSLRRWDNWRTSWDMIVPGRFDDGDCNGLLFYDRQTEEAEFYSVVDEGEIRLLNGYSNWRATWSQIVPGEWNEAEFTDLLFYDPSP